MDMDLQACLLNHEGVLVATSNPHNFQLPAAWQLG